MTQQQQVDPQLGPLVNELGPGWQSRVAGFFLVLVFAGIAILAGVANDNSVLIALSAGVALALLGLVQFIATGARVRVYEHGIERCGRFRTRRMAWNDLRSYHLQIIDTAMAAGGAGGVLGALLARAVIRAVRKNRELLPNSVILRAADGSKVVLSANVKGYADLLKTLVPFLAERLFPLARQAYDSGAQVSFGKKLSIQRGVGIKFNGLFGRTQVLPLELAASATLDQAAFAIRRNDTNAVWQSVPAAAVENLGVFQKFVTTFGKPYDDRVPMAWTS